MQSSSCSTAAASSPPLRATPGSRFLRRSVFGGAMGYVLNVLLLLCYYAAGVEFDTRCLCLEVPTTSCLSLIKSLRSIPPAVDPVCSAQRKLVLKGLKLRSIPKDLLVRVRNLENLDLSKNNLTDISEDIFSSSDQLQTLTLSSNYLITMTPGIFENLTRILDVPESAPNNVFVEIKQIFENELYWREKFGYHEWDEEGIEENAELTKSLRTSTSEETYFNKYTKARMLLNTTRPDDVLNIGTPRINLKEPDVVFRHLKRLAHLDLSDNAITVLPYWLLSSLLELKYLDISSNLLLKVSNTAFSNNEKLRTVDMSRNKLSTIPEYLFKNTTLLTTLNISWNVMEFIPGTAFSRLTNLKYLRLERNKISSIPPEAFENLNQLEILDLSHNKLTTLSRNLFSHLWNLQTLQLKNNMLTSLTPKLFFSLQRLSSLDLAHNSLQNISEELFLKGNSLKKLDLSNNKLDYIDPKFLSALERLEILLFDFNNIVGIHQDLFKHTKNLVHLSFRNNKLQKIPDYSLGSLVRLKNLELSGNNFSVLTNHVFSNLTNLESLDMLYSRFSVIEENVFDDLTSLLTLAMSLNRVVHLPPKVFQYLRRLSSLDMSLNQIRVFPKNMFDNLINVQSLNFKTNKIINIGTFSLQKMKVLEHLILQDNKIKVISEYAFYGLDKLGYLDLSRNEIIWIHHGTFRQLKNLNQLYLHQNKLYNIPSKTFHGLSGLNMLDLNDNFLSDIPDLRQCVNLTDVDFGKNLIQTPGLEAFKSLFLSKDLQRTVAFGNNPFIVKSSAIGHILRSGIYMASSTPKACRCGDIILDQAQVEICFMDPCAEGEDWTTLIRDANGKRVRNLRMVFQNESHVTISWEKPARMDVETANYTVKYQHIGDAGCGATNYSYPSGSSEEQVGNTSIQLKLHSNAFYKISVAPAVEERKAIWEDINILTHPSTAFPTPEDLRWVETPESVGKLTWTYKINCSFFQLHFFAEFSTMVRNPQPIILEIPADASGDTTTYEVRLDTPLPGTEYLVVVRAMWNETAGKAPSSSSPACLSFRSPPVPPQLQNDTATLVNDTLKLLKPNQYGMTSVSFVVVTILEGSIGGSRPEVKNDTLEREAVQHGRTPGGLAAWVCNEIEFARTDYQLRVEEPEGAKRFSFRFVSANWDHLSDSWLWASSAPLVVNKEPNSSSRPVAAILPVLLFRLLCIYTWRVF